MEIIYGRDASEDLIVSLIKIDEVVYEEELQGSYKSVIERFNKNKDTFIIVKDGDVAVGYMCYIPLTENTVDRILNMDKLVDDDITKNDIVKYKDMSTVYILSVAVLPAYQDTRVIRVITNEFFKVLLEKDAAGKRVRQVLASAVSGDGERYLKRLGCCEVKEINSGYKVFRLCRYN